MNALEYTSGGVNVGRIITYFREGISASVLAESAGIDPAALRAQLLSGRFKNEAISTLMDLGIDHDAAEDEIKTLIENNV